MKYIFLLCSVLISILLTQPSLAATQDISLLDTHQFIGEESYRVQNVSSAGDMNGDGYDDILVGTYGYDTYRGAAFVFYGKADAITETNLSNADVIITGEAILNDFSEGMTTGDFNGDGYSDIALGAYRNDEIGSDNGKVYIIFGGTDLNSVIDSADITTTFVGNSSYLLGHRLSSGDVNGDGIDDLLMSANQVNKAYLMYGIESGWSGTYTITDMDVEFTSSSAGNFGVSLAIAGDVNGDTFADILIGDNEDDTLANDAGAAYLTYGQAEQFDSPIDINDVGAKFLGETEYDYSGLAVSGAGDINADGYADFMIASYADDTTAYDAGRVSLYYGSSTMFDGQYALAEANIIILGEAENDSAGLSLSYAGDVNNDGYDDIMIGAYRNNANSAEEIEAGAAYIIYGQANNSPDLLYLTYSATKLFGEEREYAAYRIAGAGDVNNDGMADLLVSGGGNESGGENAGAAYLVYSDAIFPAVISVEPKANGHVQANYDDGTTQTFVVFSDKGKPKANLSEHQHMVAVNHQGTKLALVNARSGVKYATKKIHAKDQKRVVLKVFTYDSETKEGVVAVTQKANTITTTFYQIPKTPSLTHKQMKIITDFKKVFKVNVDETGEKTTITITSQNNRTVAVYAINNSTDTLKQIQ